MNYVQHGRFSAADENLHYVGFLVDLVRAWTQYFSCSLFMKYQLRQTFDVKIEFECNLTLKYKDYPIPLLFPDTHTL